MHIERWYPADHAVTMTCHEILQAATAADDPLGPVMSLRRMLAVVEPNPDPMETWFVHGATSGSALGWYWLPLPDLENVDRAYLRMAMDPDCRRQGIGTELLLHACRRAALRRRKALVTDLHPGTGAAAFALHAGATPGVVAQRRVPHLDKVPADKIAELSETARRAAPEYSLRHWAGRTPGRVPGRGRQPVHGPGRRLAIRGGDGMAAVERAPGPRARRR
jgi:GNAT superfamily N-acetyltransferase